MVATLQDLIRQALVLGTSIFLAALFAVGIFFAVSLLLVPIVALRKGVRSQEEGIEQNQTEE